MAEGRRVAGRYHLLEPIGRGGMGIVWRAHDELLDRAVAVKEVLYHPMGEEDQEAFNRRTIREARAAGRISHPNVVVVHDVIEEEGRPWIVMQLVQARSLGEVLREHGPLIPERVASIGLQVLDALCTAHAAGVLHRDVKPENVLLSGDNRVVLTDFGIATMPEETGLTMTGVVTGTPAFLPPERLNGDPATPQSDLWSLGATLYAAVEGRPPFDRNSPIATMAAVLHEEPEPPRRAGALTPVLEGLLRKDPAQRIDAVETAELLQAAASGGASRLQPGRDSGVNPFEGTHGGHRTAGDVPGPAGGYYLSDQGNTHSGLGHSGTVGNVGGTAGGPARRPSRVRVILLILLPVLLAGVGIGGWYGYHTVIAPGDPSPGPASPTATDKGSASPSEPAASPSPSPSRTGALPRGWETHTDDLGFSIALPPGWTPYKRTATRVWFHGPGMPGSYLQVDLTSWTDDDPVSALTTVEATSTKQGLLLGYQRIDLRPRRFRGLPSADWEFSHVLKTGKVRVLDRAFEMDGQQVAILWQTPDNRWTTGMSYFQVFASTFRLE
ncbi:serine/threonine-protein kinase [Planotetraspora sp. GP83]|uniref:serine/threonine-protein kinase n=1 Tax=Planotetraspora sp. GP83 TaxID=3156264 RepID=UPI00351611E0